MKKRNTIASIDVGTTKICTIIADANDGEDGQSNADQPDPEPLPSDEGASDNGHDSKASEKSTSVGALGQSQLLFVFIAIGTGICAGFLIGIVIARRGRKKQ